METIDGVLRRLRSEYVEMPGLRLTAEQIQRLCGIERAVCHSVLETLVDTKFLCVTANRMYARPTDDMVARGTDPSARLHTEQRPRQNASKSAPRRPTAVPAH